MNYYTTEPKAYPDHKPQDTGNEFFGDGWSVKQAAGKFFSFLDFRCHAGGRR
jgi:hypothetical protein